MLEIPETARCRATADTTRMINGGLTSRWGLRGTEDRRGGIQAHSKPQQRLYLSTGEVPSPVFKGEARMGLLGGFDQLTLGRGHTVHDCARAVSIGRSVFDWSQTLTAQPPHC